MTKFTEHLRRRWLAIPVRLWALLGTLCCLSLALFVLSASLNVVFVSDSDGNSRMLVTSEEDPHQLMRLSGIMAEEHDQFYYTAYSGNLASLSIQRAYEVFVDADGVRASAKLCSGTVEDVLAATGVTLGEHDYTEPSLHTPVAENDAITVHRVEYRDTVTYEAIPFETEYVYTSLFYRNRGRTMTLQTGHEGTNEITHRERVVDGEVESSQVVSVVQTVAPKNTIIKKYQAGAPCRL